MLVFSSRAALAYDFLERIADCQAIGRLPGAGRIDHRAPTLKDAMTRRTRGREIALQVLYQTEQNPGFPPEEVRRFVERRLRGDRKLCEFAEALIAGVQANQPRIDALISEVAENWRLDRMAAIDRNILRLGAYEMLFCPDVPTKVAINESLELAKRYSTAQSSRFVNGILDRLQAAEAAPPPARPDEAGPAVGESEPEPEPGDEPRQGPEETEAPSEGEF
jgi:N utilization substance protein B